MTPLKSTEPSDIMDIVEIYIQANQPEDYAVVMDRKEIKHDHDWWYIVVHPSNPDIRATEYTRRLEDIETKIAKEHGINVLLVPLIED